jgi:hypothetical protein
MAKKLVLTIGERDLIQEALLNYKKHLELLISLPDEPSIKKPYESKIDSIISLGLKVN